eukprot:928202-Prymnesium_polylepis.1
MVRVPAAYTSCASTPSSSWRGATASRRSRSVLELVQPHHFAAQEAAERTPEGRGPSRVRCPHSLRHRRLSLASPAHNSPAPATSPLPSFASPTFGPLTSASSAGLSQDRRWSQPQYAFTHTIGEGVGGCSKDPLALTFAPRCLQPRFGSRFELSPTLQSLANSCTDATAPLLPLVGSAARSPHHELGSSSATPACHGAARPPPMRTAPPRAPMALGSRWRWLASAAIGSQIAAALPSLLARWLLPCTRGSSASAPVKQCVGAA